MTATINQVKFTVESTKADVLAQAGAPAERAYYTAEWQDFAIVAGNITVNAVYTPVDYTATFFDENGSSCGTVTFNVETASIVNPAVPTKDGYTVTWPDWFTPGMHGDTDVIAVYKANKYKATFNDENDKFVGEVEYTVEDSVEAILAKAPAVPAKVGYEPGEWVLESVVSGGMTIKPVYNTLELFLEELNKKIDDNDPDVIKYYTVKFIWHDGSSEKKYVKGATVEVPTVGSYVYGGFTYEFTGWDKAVVAVDGNAEYNAQYTEPRSMDDVIEAEKKADDIIGNKDYYEEDRKAVEDAKKELDEYLDETGVVIDENGNVTNNPVAKDSEEDAKITELVQKLNDAINTANKNKEERDKAFNKTSGFLGWLTRLLILVRHLLNMV